MKFRRLELCNLSDLTELALFNNRLTGKIPTCLGSGLLALDAVELGANDLSGSIPSGLCESSSLTILALFDNRITGTLPPCLGRDLPALLWLEVSGNELTGSIPADICNLRNLKQLTLSGNRLEGNIPSCLGTALPELRLLELSNNMFTSNNMFAEENWALSALQTLRLHDLPHLSSWTMPPCFATHLTSLQTFVAYKSGLSGALPPVWSLPKLQVLILPDNSISGTLPSAWNTPWLTGIVLSNNKYLSGTLPQTLVTQPLLNALAIEGTRLHGGLLELCSNASRLQMLYLSGNKLSGSLPSCISALDQLKELRLAYNRFTGEIPHSIEYLKLLRVLDLSHNRFRGRVPDGLGLLAPQLVEASLEFNRLACVLPHSVQYWTSSTSKSEVSLLTGNRFGCSNSRAELCSGLSDRFLCHVEGTLAKTDSGAAAYQCGWGALIPLVPVVVGSIIFFGLASALSWRKRRVSAASLVSQRRFPPCDLLSQAMHSVVCLGGLVCAIALLILVTMPAAYWRADSEFACQYEDQWSLALKSSDGAVRYADWSVSLIAVDWSVSLIAIVGVMIWYKREEGSRRHDVA